MLCSCAALAGPRSRAEEEDPPEPEVCRVWLERSTAAGHPPETAQLFEGANCAVVGAVRGPPAATRLWSWSEEGLLLQRSCGPLCGNTVVVVSRSAATRTFSCFETFSKRFGARGGRRLWTKGAPAVRGRRASSKPFSRDAPLLTLVRDAPVAAMLLTPLFSRDAPLLTLVRDTPASLTPSAPALLTPPRSAERITSSLERPRRAARRGRSKDDVLLVRSTPSNKITLLVDARTIDSSCGRVCRPSSFCPPVWCPRALVPTTSLPGPTMPCQISAGMGF